MQFAVDNMLGKLARWLRILGYDAFYDSSLSVKQLVERANQADRVLLTRRRVFPDGVFPTTMFNVCSENFPDQLRCVIHAFDLDAESKLFSRCLQCNLEVHQVNKQSVQGRVPEQSLKGFDEFFECPGCHSVYWGGSHRRNTLRKLQQILTGEVSEGDSHGTQNRPHH